VKIRSESFGVKKATVVLLAAALNVGLLEAPAQAAVTWDLKPSGAGDYDWTLGSYHWYQELNNNLGRNTFSLRGILWGNSAAECLEYSTAPGRYYSNPDTRIWVWDGAANVYRSINDDFGGTLQSKARVWIALDASGGEYDVQVAPWSTDGNSDDFKLTVTRRDLTEAQCTTGQTTIPWAKVKGAGNATTLELSSNAG